MKCPHCFKSVGFFSDEMKELAKQSACPHCGKAVKLGIIHSRFAMGFVPVALVAILLGMSGPIAAGIAGGVGALAGLGIKSGDA